MRFLICETGEGGMNSWFTSYPYPTLPRLHPVHNTTQPGDIETWMATASLGDMMEYDNGFVIRVRDPKDEEGIVLKEPTSFFKHISGAIKVAIDAHGPITLENYGSATKRVIGALKDWRNQKERL